MTAERTNHAVALTLLYRADATMTTDRGIQRLVVTGDRDCDRLRRLLPTSRRTLDIAHEERDRARRQRKRFASLAVTVAPRAA